jgi:NitT/TauT family transport system substrate-binding protein
MTHSKEVRLAVIVLAFGLFSLATASVRRWRLSHPYLIPIKVQLKWWHQAQFAGFYVAKAKNYYRDVGLDVELLEGGLDKPALPVVVSGSAQFGVIGPEAILLARSRGVDVIAVAVIYQKSPFCLFTYASYGINKIADLKGKDVGVLYGSNELIGYRAMLKKAKLDKSKDHINEVLVQDDLDALRKGRVQAFPGYWIDEAEALQEECDDQTTTGARCKIKELDGSDVGNFGDTIFTTERFERENHDIVEKFIKATLKGWQFALKNQAAALEIIMKQATTHQRGKRHQCLMLRNSEEYICPDRSNCVLGYTDYQKWKSLQEMLVDNGLLEHDSQVDLTRSFDPSFVTNPTVQISLDPNAPNPCQ